MKLQRITRVVDARAAQGRVVLWLACGHKLSVGGDGRPFPRTGEKTNCSFCPGPTPVDVRSEKTPQQLYRKAGEP